MPSARPAWDKKPRFPGLDLSDREVDIVYEMCDTLSRNRAYIEKDFSTEKTLFADILSNTHAAKLLGAFDESRFIELLQNDPACPAGSRGCTARRCVERIDTGKRPEFPYGFSRYRTRKRFRFVKTSKITFTLLIYWRSPSAPFERPLTLRLENSQPPVYSPAASGRLVLLEPIGDAPRKLLIDTIEQHSRISAAYQQRRGTPVCRVPHRHLHAYLSGGVCVTPSLCPNRHALCASPTQTAFAWRLPSCCAAFLEQQARSTRPLMILPAIHTPTGWNLPERWITIARQFIRHALLTNENSRAAFDRISGEAERVAKEAQLSRARNNR